MIFISILTFFALQTEAADLASVSTAALSFSGGEPGCLQEVGSHVISDDQAKSVLSEKCQAFRKSYLEAANQLAEKPADFQKQLTTAIRKTQTVGFPKPPYDAFLLAALTRSQEQVKPLTEYSNLEKKKKVRFKYASAALERVKFGKCKTFTEAIYDELCKSYDPAIDRLVSLNDAAAKGKR